MKNTFASGYFFKSSLGSILVLLPGALLLGMGLLAIIAPRLMFTLLTVLALYFAFILLSVGWKIYRFQRQIKRSMEQFKDSRMGQGPFGSSSDSFRVKRSFQIQDLFSEFARAQKEPEFEHSSGSEVLEGEVLDSDENIIKRKARSKKSSLVVDISKVIVH